MRKLGGMIPCFEPVSSEELSTDESCKESVRKDWIEKRKVTTNQDRGPAPAPARSASHEQLAKSTTVHQELHINVHVSFREWECPSVAFQKTQVCGGNVSW
jgi:hypothetical protein